MEILTQATLTLEQHKYLSKLMGYDYTITYKAGHDNQVANVLSRQFKAEGQQFGWSIPYFSFSEDLKKEYTTILAIQQVISDLEQGKPIK